MSSEYNSELNDAPIRKDKKMLRIRAQPDSGKGKWYENWKTIYTTTGNTIKKRFVMFTPDSDKIRYASHRGHCTGCHQSDRSVSKKDTDFKTNFRAHTREQIDDYYSTEDE
jgi:hypothetical protein